MGFRSWIQENPALCLAVLVALSGMATLLEAMARHRRARFLRELASQWHMTYSAHDRLRVGARIARRLSIPGAADVSVADVIYGTRGGNYVYVFTAEYTTGVVWGKQRHQRVACFAESRGRQSPDAPGRLALAPEGLDLLEQYRALAPSA